MGRNLVLCERLWLAKMCIMQNLGNVFRISRSLLASWFCKKDWDFVRKENIRFSKLIYESNNSSCYLNWIFFERILKSYWNFLYNYRINESYLWLENLSLIYAINCRLILELIRGSNRQLIFETIRKLVD